jgi:SOS-response transcriptional repressor LexA
MMKKNTTAAAVHRPLKSPRMGESLIRVERLKAYRDSKNWDDAELARHIRRSQSQVSDWFNHRRHIGEKLARAIEDELKLPRFFLDDRQYKAGSGSPDPRHEGSPPSEGTAKGVVEVTKPVQLVPRVQWGELDSMLEDNESPSLVASEQIATYVVASRKAKMVQVADGDDSMTDQIQPGDHLLLDPEMAPRAGDIVLISVHGGERIIRKYLPRAGGAFSAQAANPNYAELRSDIDGLEVLAVMLEHRRYRKP